MEPKALADAQIQLTLLGEAVASADVGFLVWDEDRHYVAANACACEILGCSLEQLLGSVVGGRTEAGDDAVERVVRGEGGRGELVVKRFDTEEPMDTAPIFNTIDAVAPMSRVDPLPATVNTPDHSFLVSWSGNDDPNGRWNVYYRSSADGGGTWSAEAKLSQYVPGYSYKYGPPKDGFAEPYGDYFELDIDGGGLTHAIWGEGPSYVGPGNVWYARGR